MPSRDLGDPPVSARTASKRILGVMNEDARMCDYAIASAGGLAHLDVLDLNRGLRRSLHTVDGGGYATALDAVRARSGA